MCAVRTSARSLANLAIKGLRSAKRRIVRHKDPLHGQFGDWGAACKQATGYHQPIILDRLIAAAEEANSSGGQKFDRDGVAFNRPITPFPLLVYILQAAVRCSDQVQVIDFGGGLGSTYRQCRSFLSRIPSLHWNIVEQSHVAAAGRSRFQSDVLRFHDNLAEAAADATPDVVIFSSVLQYLDDPYSIVDQAMRLRPQTILIDRTPFCENPDDLYSVQIVDDTIFPARLPFRIFGKNRLEEKLSAGYRQIGEFVAIDRDMLLGTQQVKFRGLAFEIAESDRN